MTHPFLEAVARGLLDRGAAVARFHFPYMERIVREGRRRLPDRLPVLLETWRAVLREARRWRTAGPLFLAGKSLGGRMASLILAGGEAPRARGAIYLGYPLHPAGKPEKLRDAHLPDVGVPQLFVSGTRDPLCDLDLLRPVLRRIGPAARLHEVPGGDHSLARSRKDPLAGSGEWLDAIAAFVRRVVARALPD
jgi:predicted alpha/beta-hydrolase family hydrolase